MFFARTLFPLVFLLYGGCGEKSEPGPDHDAPEAGADVGQLNVSDGSDGQDSDAKEHDDELPGGGEGTFSVISFCYGIQCCAGGCLEPDADFPMMCEGPCDSHRSCVCGDVISPHDGNGCAPGCKTVSTCFYCLAGQFGFGEDDILEGPWSAARLCTEEGKSNCDAILPCIEASGIEPHLNGLEEKQVCQ